MFDFFIVDTIDLGNWLLTSHTAVVCPHIGNRIKGVQPAGNIVPIFKPRLKIFFSIHNSLLLFVGKIVDEVIRVAVNKAVGFQSVGVSGNGLSGYRLTHFPHTDFLNFVRHSHKDFIFKEVVVEVPEFNEVSIAIKAQFGDAVDPEKFIIAVIDSSPEKLWDAYTPEHQQKLIASNGSKESARQQLELLIGLFRRTLLLEAGQKLANQLICIDGQWFLAPDTADRSSKEAVTAEFVKAVYVNNDMAAFWQLFAPQLQNAQIKAYGSESNAKAALRQKFLGKATGEQLARKKEDLKDKDFFAETVKKMLSRQNPDDLIQINGKWYINKL